MARKEKKYHYIYKTTNLKNGKFYVGMHSTDNLNDGYLGSGTRLRRAIRKYGLENFKIEILEFFDNRTDLINREVKLINEDLLKNPMCMNLKPGGGGGFCNDTHKKKFQSSGTIAAAKSGFNKKKIKWLWENDIEWGNKYKQKLSVAGKGNLRWLGKKHNEKTKQKIGMANSIKQKGESNSQFGSKWITNEKENRKIKINEIIPNGWKLGRTAMG